jgi:hypothetical protein
VTLICQGRKVRFLWGVRCSSSLRIV